MLILASLLTRCQAQTLCHLKRRSTRWKSRRTLRRLRDKAQRVLGVRLQRPDGSLEAVACDALLLACNGYGGAPDLLQRFVPEMVAATFAGHPGNDGTAVRWGEALGARLADLRAYQGHGSWAVPHAVLITWALMVEGGVQINARGERFHDESQGYSEAALHVVAQPGGRPPTEFAAQRVEAQRIVFANPQNDFPKYIDYRRDGDRLEARLSAAAPDQDLERYGQALVARFANPALNHQLIQIAMDGSQKLPQRWLETLAANQQQGRDCPAILAGIGGWIRHLRGANGPVDDPRGAELAPRRSPRFRHCPGTLPNRRRCTGLRE